MTARKSPPRASLFYFYNLSSFDRPSFMLELMHDYGDIVKIPSPVRTFLLNKPEYLEHVLQKNSANYQKAGVALKPLQRLLGDGLLMLDGPEWQHRRKLLAPLFQPRAIAQFHNLIVTATLEMITEWKKQQYKKIDIHHESMKLVLNIAAKALFSSSFATTEIDEIISAIALENKYVCTWLAIFPNLPTIGHFRWKKAQATLERYIKRMIDNTRNNKENPDNLLTLLLAAQKQENLTEQDIFDETKTFLLTGHETTGNALTWTWYLLSQNIHSYHSMELEIQQVLQNKLCAQEDIEKLEYTHNVFQESLRLYPPIWITGRKANAADNLDDYYIPAKTDILISAYTMHRHPDFWPNPELFMPERFSVQNIAKRPRYSYIPFGAGPRSCIASHFATQMAITILATLAQHFYFYSLSDEPIAIEHLVSLKPKQGIWLGLKEK